MKTTREGGKMSEDFYGLRPNDDVNVHGRGFGKIIECHKADYPSDDWVRVVMSQNCICSTCGNYHVHRQTVQIHPMHVSLNSRVAQERAEQRKAKSA
jgi:hypothetical protein